VSIDPGPAGAEVLASRLRAHDPPVIALIRDGRVLLDPRTLDWEEALLAARAVREALA
jgi:hypothetical protein